MNVLEQRQAEAVVSIAKTLRSPDLEQRRYEIAKDILSTMFYRPENHSLTVEADVDFAVEVADILIEKLKKGEQ